MLFPSAFVIIIKVTANNEKFSTLLAIFNHQPHRIILKCRKQNGIEKIYISELLINSGPQPHPIMYHPLDPGHGNHSASLP